MNGEDFRFDDVLWFFRSYVDVNDFAARVPSAAATIALTGFILASFGVSPGIASAVGILGIATTFTEPVLRFLLNSEDPTGKLGVKARGSAFGMFVAVGFVVFLFLGEGSIGALIPSIIQYGLGLFLTYLAGVVFQIVYTDLDNAGASVRVRILLSVFTAIGFMSLLFVVVPQVFSLLGLESWLDVVRSTPKEIAGGA